MIRSGGQLRLRQDKDLVAVCIRHLYASGFAGQKAAGEVAQCCLKGGALLAGEAVNNLGPAV